VGAIENAIQELKTRKRRKERTKQKMSLQI
jgi:hypothetical protein